MHCRLSELFALTVAYLSYCVFLTEVDDISLALMALALSLTEMISLSIQLAKILWTSSCKYINLYDKF